MWQGALLQDFYRELEAASLQNLEVCCQKTAGLGKIGAVILCQALTIKYQSPHLGAAEMYYCLFWGGAWCQERWHPAAASTDAFAVLLGRKVLEFVLGIGAAATSLLKIW